METFAETLGIDRRGSINDDVSHVDETARALGRSAMRSLLTKVFWRKLRRTARALPSTAEAATIGALIRAKLCARAGVLRQEVQLYDGMPLDG